MKAVVFSLGCKVNAYEGQGIIELLESMGIETYDKPQYADVYILNTCSVTSEADRKSRQAVERLKRYNRDAKILVLGCSAQNDPQRYLCKQNVTAVSGTGSKIEAVKRFMSHINSCDDRFYGTTLPTAYEDNITPAATKTRGYIKIQDGCNRFCSYCKIPYLRGRSRSRSVASVVDEAMKISETSGEIILTGIDVADYHTDEGGLDALIRALKVVPVRKRLSSLECSVVTDELLDAMEESGFCDHFHLSLQSGSTRILAKMNRHYTAEEYLAKTKLIYRHFPYAAITTDIIAGFPTESEADHEATKDTVMGAKFAAIHVFPYSLREGTAAAKMEQVEPEVRSRRVDELLSLGAEMRNEFLKRNIGREAEVYAETTKGGLSEGFTSNYIKVYSPLKEGELKKLKLVALFRDGLKGEII